MKLSKTEIEAIQHEMTLYEDPGAATIEALKIVQEHRGWVSDESLEAAAAVVGVTPTQMEAVATFYNLIFRQPVGRHVIMICDSISCYLTGYEEILAYLKKTLGIEFGQTTPDNRFTLLPICCLGNCDNGPAMRINTDYHGRLTPDKVDAILAEYP
ncbi:NADH-quinone oxidoreductase subunit E protein [Salinisphaera shabanensis E1L3A]|uniref:NADH-quinone oxidoreductase subunit E n=1 Tax=Salinisphaera shabanensis E1L3A TaxID=1033802 RepID=U2G1U5_9GAMM|nr:MULTISPECIES: NADH-quinone oxidoreductase subunit NuoE [Salinisphaera]ERJ20188.1 NADH-quinone oxidoreductase subunit E protein [Salinisphaera shabanensis E1L3A]MBS61852.1 NADH-quinone oxidoreductase subunit NuoE [Salinisphaera sp.]